MFLALALPAWGLRRCAAVLLFLGSLSFGQRSSLLSRDGEGAWWDWNSPCVTLLEKLLTSDGLYYMSTVPVVDFVEIFEGIDDWSRSLWGSWVHLSVVWTISSGAITFSGCLERSRSLRQGGDRKFSIFLKGLWHRWNLSLFYHSGHPGILQMIRLWFTWQWFWISP